MEAAGKWLELSGTLLTMYGLWFAWNRNSNRRLRLAISRWTAFVSNKTRHATATVFPCLRRSATVIVPAADAWAFAVSATVTVRSGVDPGQALTIQVQVLAGQIEAMANDLQALRQRIEKNEVAQKTLANNADRAADSAVTALRESGRLEAFTDLSVALAGIFITAVGIVLGMVADGRFSWLPW
ncbi:hypothetical protein ACQP0C_01650 [Nocardia sp. CA-129566]|uniref:hypothetical protein n=1 Tax=Nocardia sp. CA-129566 TaxID=3239976 RepID=UPI003D9699DC